MTFEVSCGALRCLRPRLRCVLLRSVASVSPVPSVAPIAAPSRAAPLESLSIDSTRSQRIKVTDMHCAIARLADAQSRLRFAVV